MTPQEKKEIREKWTEKNNQMLWTTVTESEEVLDFWLALLDTKLKQQLEKIESEIEELEKYEAIEGKPYGKAIGEVLAIISKYKEI